MRFRATIGLHGKTATGIVVPDEVVAALGSSRRPAVRVTLIPTAGPGAPRYAYRSTVTPMGGRYLLPVSGEVRTASGVSAGDVVDVVVELDDVPREVTVPDDLAAALAGQAEASQFFESLSFTNKQAYVVWIEQAKKPETRQARVERTVDALRDGRKQR